jgi:Zn ribbon nucleic-acid-binding protein
VATLVTRNAKEDMVVPVVGSDGVCASCVGAFRRNLASVGVKMFSNLMYFMKKCYKFCTFYAIWEGKAAIKCIDVQQKKKKVHSRQLWRVIYYGSWEINAVVGTLECVRCDHLRRLQITTDYPGNSNCVDCGYCFRLQPHALCERIRVQPQTLATPW